MVLTQFLLDNKKSPLIGWYNINYNYIIIIVKLSIRIYFYYKNNLKVLPVKCNINEITNSTMKIKNITLATAAAPIDILENPNNPATIAMITKRINSSTII